MLCLFTVIQIFTKNVYFPLMHHVVNTSNYTSNVLDCIEAVLWNVCTDDVSLCQILVVPKQVKSHHLLHSIADGGVWVLLFDLSKAIHNFAFSHDSSPTPSSPEKADIQKKRGPVCLTLYLKVLAKPVKLMQ